jgi:hypothetical protein
MKKSLIVFGIIAVAGFALATDTLITGFPATTGIGTFKVTSDGTDATLTVNKATITTLVISGTNITGNIGVAQMTNALAGTAYTTNTLTGDGKTNVFIWNTVGNVKVLKSITTTP